MGQADIHNAIMQAEAALLTMKLNRQRRLHQIEEDNHNIAMMLVRITELRAAEAQYLVDADD